jgi:hypothetical protein
MGMEYGGELGNWALLECDLPEEKKNYYNVATAASITGWVRAYLFESICKAEGVVYCDTDSIFCTDAPNLKLSKELGDWGIDGEFKAGGGVAGKKLYSFELKVPKRDKKTGEIVQTHKVASKGAKLTPAQVIQVCQGETVLYKRDSPTYSLKKPPEFIDRRIRMT